MTVASTSIAAKRSIGPASKTLRGEIFRCILAHGAFGATLNEISDELEIRLQTTCARRNELGKKGLVIDSGARRLTDSNRKAIVWTVPNRVAEAAVKKGIL